MSNYPNCAKNQFFVVKKCEKNYLKKLNQWIVKFYLKKYRNFPQNCELKTATAIITTRVFEQKEIAFFCQNIEIKNTVCEEIMIFCAYNKRKIRFQQNVDIIDVSISVHLESNQFEKDIKNYIESTVFGFPS